KSSEDDDDDDEEKISKHDDDVDDQSDDDDQDDDDQDDDDNEQTDLDNDDDEDNNEDSHEMNVEGDKLDDKGANKEDEANELYRGVNINLKGRDIQMADVQTTQVIEDTHVTLTPINLEGQQQSSSVSSRFILNMLNPSPDIGIDSICESTPRVDVLVTTTAEPPLLSTTLPPPSIPIISHMQQTPAPLPTNVPSSSMQDLPNFGSLFGRRDDEDKDEEPSAGSNRGSKKRRTGKEPESTSLPKEKTSKTSSKSTEGSKSHHKTASKSALAEEPMHTTQDLEEPAPQEFETGATNDQLVEEASQHPHCNLAKKADSQTSFNELMDTPVNFSAFVMNRLKVDTLTPELLAGPTYELMKGSCKSLVELEFFLEEVYKATTDQLDWNNPEGQQCPHDLLKPLPLIPNSRGRKRQQFYEFAITRESARDVYSKRRNIAVTELQLVEWHNYKHLDWITVRRDDDKLYKLKEGDFKRLRIQDIEDMLLLLYLPQTIWRRSDKDRAAAMIQAIDKQLKTRRIIRSLEKFVGGRLYEGDFWLLQRTI
nr:hypothetical protein [Tanacetum cinerariifolium]